MEVFVQGIFGKHGRRFYAVVNYEGTEIAPEIIEYYGERIKKLYDLYGIATVRYSSSGFTRSVLRYHRDRRSRSGDKVRDFFRDKKERIADLDSSSEP